MTKKNNKKIDNVRIDKKNKKIIKKEKDGTLTIRPFNSVEVLLNDRKKKFLLDKIQAHSYIKILEHMKKEFEDEIEMYDKRIDKFEDEDISDLKDINVLTEKYNLGVVNEDDLNIEPLHKIETGRNLYFALRDYNYYLISSREFKDENL